MADRENAQKFLVQGGAVMELGGLPGDGVTGGRYQPAFLARKCG
jgi:hypothetical protein